MSVSDRAAAYRAARIRLLVAVGGLLGAGAVLPLAARACAPKPPPLAVPPELLQAGATFPAAVADLRPATPLAPLLAADAPEQLAVIEPRAKALNLRPGDPITVRFNRPMVDGSRVGKPAEAAAIALDPPVRGKVRWTSRSTVSFEAEAATWSATRKAKLSLVEGLRSLAGEQAPEIDPLTVIFDAGPRFMRAKRAAPLVPGEPLELLFSGNVDAAALRAEMMIYEVDGGRRMLGFSATPGARDKNGLVPVALRLQGELEPGAHFAVALAPPIAWGGSSPRVLDFQVKTRPRIEGIDCPKGAGEAAACNFQGPPGQIVDIGEALRLLSSEPIDKPGEEAIVVRPAVSGLHVEVEEDRILALRAEWEPGQVYELRLGALRDHDGRALEATAPLAVRSAGRTPEVHAKSGRLAFERDVAAALRIEAIHVEEGEARVAVVPPGREIEAALFPAKLTAPDASWKRAPLHDLVPSSRPNRWGKGTVPWLEGTKPGIAVISLLPDHAARELVVPPATLLQRTDLGVSARVLASGALIWVTSVSEAQPAAGAKVTVADMEGTAVGEAVTDARGVAWVPLAVSLLAKGGAVGAARGDDRAVIVIDPRTSMGPRHLSATPGEAPPAPDAKVASVFVDRGICRPGETIHAKAVIRSGTAELLPPVVGMAHLRLHAPGGEAPIEDRLVPISAFGTADADFTVREGAELGAYRIEARLDGEDRAAGAATFTVGEYRPPTFRVDLSGGGGDLVDRDPIHLEVAASHLFGPPAAGLSARWSLVREGAGNYPARWESYAFSPFDASARGGTIASGEVKLDEQGHAAVDTALTAASPMREEAIFEVTVRDVSGLSTSARRRLSARPAAFEVGVRRTRAWLDAGAELDVEAIVIGADGAAAAGRAIEARVVREGWHTYWEWSKREAEADDDEGGGYEARRSKKREVVHRCALTSAEAPVHCAWKADRPGTYVLEATARDEKGRVSVASQRVYVAGPDEHPDRDAPGTAIALTPAKPTYEVGQTAEIAFESPFPEADALLTVERDGVIVTEERRVRAGGQVFRFPVTAAMVPNAFVSLTLVRPRTGAPGKAIDLDAPDLRVGLAEIATRPAASPLAVSVELPAERAPAGSEVPVTVHVRDAAGQGVGAEVALFAVDEGTLRVTGYARPDPTAGLYRRMPPAFAWEDLRRALVSRIEEPLSASAGGDGSSSAAAKRAMEEERFEPTPLWAPRLVTDASGTVSATLRLPARPTQYRIMAVAVDAGSRAGGAERAITASMPLVVRPVLPGALTVGDRLEAVAFVHNTEDTPAEVTVTPIVGGAPRAARQVTIAPRSEARVGEWIDAARAGDLAVRFEARSGSSAAHAEAHVRIAARGRTARSEVVGGLVDSRTIALALPAALADGEGAVTLTIAAHPFVGIDGSIAAVLDAPAAGTESLASAVIALAAYGALDAEKRPGAIGTVELEARLRSTIAELARLQTKAGGFGDFSASSTPDPYLSAYALRALTVARRAGQPVPEDVIHRARGYVHGDARDTVFLDRSNGGHDALAAALRALTEAEEADADRINALWEQRERLTPVGLAELALAMDPSDRRRDTAALDAAREVLVTREEERKNPRVLRWYDGSARTLGAVLEAALAVPAASTEAGKVAARLLAARTEGMIGWGSTHETSHALAALAAYARTVRADSKLDARVLLDGAPLAPAGRSALLTWYQIPAARVGGAAHALRIEARGSAWFALASRHEVPLGAADEVARGDQAALHRVLEDAAGKPLEPGAHVRLGDLVRVRLFLHSEGATPPYLALRDRPAGGLEPIDAAHETTPRASLWALLGMGPDDDVVDARGHWAARSLDDITHRAFGPARAAFYLARSRAGLREITYGARATAVGTFVLPPAEVEALYAPAFVARSAMTTITVDP